MDEHRAASECVASAQLETDQDRELRERCVLIAMQRHLDVDLTSVLGRADRLFNYIKTGAK